MNNTQKIQDLRRIIAGSSSGLKHPPLPLGPPDAVLGGGLERGALHEIHARDWTAGGFAACLALLAAGKKPLFWVRPDYEGLEYGACAPEGLAELGGDPSALFLIKTANAAEALCASADILACPHAGALLLEIGGNPKTLDMVASRRLHFLAAANGVTAILLHQGAKAMPSAAQTRWEISAAPSPRPDWGWPSFAATLVRNRMGSVGHWHLTWDIEDGLFRDTAQTAGLMAAAPFHQPVAEKRRIAL